MTEFQAQYQQISGTKKLRSELLKFEEVENYFRQYADNKDGLVKISIDRQTYKDEKGKHAYKLSMHIGDDMITLDKNFQPAAWTNLVDKDVPSIDL